MKKILLIEDDEFIQDFVSQKLINSGYDTHVCSRGDEALTAAAKISPDVILLDLALPGRSGEELLVDFNTNANFATTPVIIFTNNDDPEKTKALMAAGAEDFYYKAMTDPSELIKKIESVLQ